MVLGTGAMQDSEAGEKRDLDVTPVGKPRQGFEKPVGRVRAVGDEVMRQNGGAMLIPHREVLDFPCTGA